MPIWLSHQWPAPACCSTTTVDLEMTPGFRYSPNLSNKRTTHLVTHPTVSIMSEKLAAVVADKQQPQPQQQRYASLCLVNLEWIKTSCRAGTKAHEAGFMPDITYELVCSSVSSQQHSDFLIIHIHQAAAQQDFAMVCSRPQQDFITSLYVLIAAAHNPHP